MPRPRRKSKFDRKKYEEQAKAKIKQHGRVKKALQRTPSGYLTPEAEKLVPGNGLMSYVYTDKLVQNKAESVQAAANASNEQIDKESNKDEAATEKEESADSEDGFLGFDDDFEGSNDLLVSQFNVFEDNLAKTAQEEKDKEAQFRRENATELPLHFPAPWNRAVETDAMPEKLSREIKNYIVYLSPTDREIKDRNDLVKRIKSAVKVQLRGAECQLFGSSAVNMYLPHADVDMVLVNDGRFDRERNILYQLKAYFMRRGWTADAIVIGRARVPIIKFTDSHTRLNVDIAIGKAGGVETIKIVEEWSRRQPALRPLVLVLKQFLKKRGLAEVYHGGLGGFATICLVMSFLENHEKLLSGEIKAMDNLGILLYEVLEFYGKTFDSGRYALRMTGKMPRVLKSTSSYLQTAKDGQISVEDPWDYTNNITRSSYNWVAVQKAFSHGADMLKRMMHEYSQDSQSASKSFLAPLLKNDLTKDRHSVEVMKQKVESLVALANGAQLPAKPNLLNNSQLPAKPTVSKRERKQQAKRKEEKNKKAKRSTERSTERSTDDHSDNSIIDLTQDTPPRKQALKQIFEPASSSESSDLEVTMVRKSTPTRRRSGSIAVKTKKRSNSHVSSEEEEEVSRTKIAGTKATEKKRAYWAKKNGLEGQLPSHNKSGES